MGQRLAYHAASQQGPSRVPSARVRRTAWMKETGAPHERVNVNGGGQANVTIIELL